MPDDSSIRMYSRSRGGEKRPQGMGAAKDAHASSASDSPPSSSTPGIGGTERFKVKGSEARDIFDKYHCEMGVSTYTLRAMFRCTKFSEMKNLDRHITSAQLARIASYSRDRRKQLDQRLDLGNLSGMDEYLLDIAFTIRPIDTLIEFVDLNQDDVDVRTLRNFLAEEDTLEETPLPDNVHLKEIVCEYRDILKGEVNLLSGENQQDKTKQIQSIAQRSRECFDKIRSLMADNKFREAVSVEDASPAEPEETIEEQSERFAGPQRITKKSMENYKRENGGM